MSDVHQPDHPLQKAWNSLWGSCLCGHSEWCCYCDGTMDGPRQHIKEAAKAAGVQLYLKSFGNFVKVNYD